MARLERLKYIPMLVRAYQEARTRAGTPRTRGTDYVMDVVAQETPSGSDTHTNGNHSVRTAGSRKRNSESNHQVKPKPAPLRPIQKVKGRAGVNRPKNTPSQTSVVRSRVKTAMESHPIVQNLLRELRATKQQLSQLTAIQTQLSEVQSKLDEQLRVLRRTVEADAQAQAPNSSAREDESL